MAQSLLKYCYLVLFFLTPLIWSPFNYELFEFNKMIFVYLMTLFIFGLWSFKSFQERAITLKRSLLDIPLLFFLVANILSTITSIDPHISLWGYYSRSNGGLLSTIAYIFLYYGLISNFSSKDVPGLLKAFIFGAVVTSIYAIPEHFGVSPSCMVLTNEFNADCWVQDVKSRVFATLGQPNWLAAYLAMAFFPCLYFILIVKSKFTSILYSLFSILIYTSFTFTYSRGATLGLISGVIILLIYLFIVTLRETKSVNTSYILLLVQNNKFRFGSFLLLIFITINLVFGSALTQFRLFSQFASPTRESVTTAVTQKPTSGTQLENGGTESGQIRLIVWKGGLEIFKQYPILGSGVETFAYSYYKFRPVEHNLVSEWDFLYNKAHNEYINYLSTTGAVGLLAYLLIIATFIVWSIRKILLQSQYSLLHITLLASYTSYLIQNIFGFSVVITSLWFFTIPALVFLTTESLHPLKLPNLRSYLRIALVVIFVPLLLWSLIQIGQFWIADNIYARGVKAIENGNPGRAYNLLYQSSLLHPSEPLYQSELAYAAATSASALGETEATLSAQMTEIASLSTDQLLLKHPNNISLFRNAIRVYYMLSALDQSFIEKTLQTLDQSINLAPTDPKLRYNKALVLDQETKYTEAIAELEKSIELKPNYREARLTLAEIYIKMKDNLKAKQQLDQVLKQIPNDPEALERLEQIN